MNPEVKTNGNNRAYQYSDVWGNPHGSTSWQCWGLEVYKHEWF